MMKYVFVLALLHLCVSARSDTNLNREIIDRLTELTELIDKVNPMPNVKAPVVKKIPVPQKCLGMIQKELGNVLDNLTVDDGHKHYISELKGNLNALGDHKVNDDCDMDKQKPKLALWRYISFFKKLNTRP